MERNARRTYSQRGFTVVEVMMACLVLLVGVLGTVTLIDNANRTTGATKAREGGNNVARDLIEAARTIPYTSLTPSGAATALQGQAGLADSDSGMAGWQVERRGVTYTVNTTICMVDDARDGIGSHDSTFCSNPTPTNPPDATPADYKRAFFDLTYDAGSGTSRVRQSAVVADDDGGPPLTSLTLTSPSSQPITSGSSAAFAIDAGTTANLIEMNVDGTNIGQATKSGSTWTFTWSLGTACSSTAQVDGTFLLSAQAYDAAGALGGAKAITVAINRCSPFGVTGVDGSQYRSNTWLEFGWTPNDERDVVGYRVYKNGSLFTCAGETAGALVTKAQCLDSTGSFNNNTNYDIVPYDRDPSGNLRAGPDLQPNFKPGTNKIPNTVTNLTATSVAQGTQLNWTLPATDDPDKSDTILYYRIYRDGTAYANRYGETDNETETSWVDTNTGGTSHTYRVVAVDNHFAESAFAGPVTQ